MRNGHRTIAHSTLSGPLALALSSIRLSSSMQCTQGEIYVPRCEHVAALLFLHPPSLACCAAAVPKAGLRLLLALVPLLLLAVLLLAVMLLA